MGPHGPEPAEVSEGARRLARTGTRAGEAPARTREILEGLTQLPIIAALVAAFASGLFTGAAIYITFVEHPARMSCGSALAATEFGPSYKRATVMQASLAIIGAGAGIIQWATGGGIAWLVSGLILGAVVPFTLVVILPTNHRLLDPWLDKASPEAGALLARWGRLHAVRSVLSLVAFVSFPILLTKG